VRFNSPSSQGAAILGLFLGLFLIGCSSPQSFIVLVVESRAPTPIIGVAQLKVVVSKGTTEMKTLSYGAGDLGGLTLVADADTSSGTLSVSFSGDETGDIGFEVQAFDAQGCQIGDGSTTVTIKKGAVNEGIVALDTRTGCTPDGGAPVGGAPDGGAPFGGCSLVHPQCAVANQTCQVNCTTKVNACRMGGSVAAGGPCQTAEDCAPGTQCFDYGNNVACTGIKICLPFCDNNSDCAAFGSGGAGPGSFCRDPVSCPGLATASHTCAFNCDPTAAARSAGQSGCPSGLACLMPSVDTVDCACPEQSRTGQEGAPCANSANCAPGLICNEQSGTHSCRSVCRCDAVGGSCTATNDCSTANTHCTIVTNQTIYGICL